MYCSGSLPLIALQFSVFAISYALLLMLGFSGRRSHHNPHKSQLGDYVSSTDLRTTVIGKLSIIQKIVETDGIQLVQHPPIFQVIFCYKRECRGVRKAFRNIVEKLDRKVSLVGAYCSGQEFLNSGLSFHSPFPPLQSS